MRVGYGFLFDMDMFPPTLCSGLSAIWIYVDNKFNGHVGLHSDSQQFYLMLKVMKQLASFMDKSDYNYYISSKL